MNTKKKLNTENLLKSTELVATPPKVEVTEERKQFAVVLRKGMSPIQKTLVGNIHYKANFLKELQAFYPDGLISVITSDSEIDVEAPNFIIDIAKHAQKPGEKR
jgi:hypothetical protein